MRQTEKSLPSEPELPEPRYRDGMASEVNNIAVSYVRVRRIELDHERRVVEGSEKYLRLSHRGPERPIPATTSMRAQRESRLRGW